jgi:hypothetical protein
MFEDPEEQPEGQPEKSRDPAEQAKEKCDEFRMFAELAAIFEANRKFDAQILPKLDPEIARECQKIIGRLEKGKVGETPVISPELAPQAGEVLNMPAARQISTNDYHIHRRPGEVMILRWLAGEEVATFYERLQAHFDAALRQYREEERQSHEWKQDSGMLGYLDALDAVDLKMENRYLRPQIREHQVFVLSTQSTDEMDISHLCDFIMGVPAAEIVGPASAPPDDPTEQDRAWFFKLFSLRGIKEGVEQMFFFTYLQKSDDSDSW